MSFDEVVETVKRQVREGREEQICLDRAAIDREWAKERPNMDVILRLSEHIEWCEDRL